MATLKNLLKSKQKTSRPNLTDHLSLLNPPTITFSDVTDSTSGLDMSISSSSSFNFYPNLPILAQRSRKQSLESSTDLNRQMESDLPSQTVLNDLCNLSELSLDEDEFKVQLDSISCESSLSSVCSGTSTSCESLEFSSDSTGSSFSSQSYDLESRKQSSTFCQCHLNNVYSFFWLIYF